MNRRKVLKIIALVGSLPVIAFATKKYSDWKKEGESRVHVNGWILKRKDLEDW